MVVMVGEREARSQEERPRMMPPQCGVTEERVVVVVGVWEVGMDSYGPEPADVRRSTPSRSVTEIDH